MSEKQPSVLIIPTMLTDRQLNLRHPEVFGAVNIIEGFDVVGEVVELGPNVSGFSPGEKVVTFARGIGPGYENVS